MSISSYNHLNSREWGTAVLVLLLSFAVVFGSRYSRLHSESAIRVSESTVLLLHDHINTGELIDILEKQPGIRFDREELKWASRILGWQRFNRGRYEFDKQESYHDFLSRLALGLQDPLRLRIPPGADKEILKHRIADQLQFEARELADVMKDTVFLNRHNIEAHQLYGRILPDTYEVYWTTSPERLLDRLLSEFDNRVTHRYADRFGELDRTVDEITTLASIIEWESRNDEEKPMISGLYWNRLNRNWRLQADPTVNYSKGERSRLVYEDYRIDHPYNTYRFRGLPPGPITNPSYTSIRAALFPEDHDYMYMVATPDGNHAFSRTYAEHRRKSREWTEWLREQRRIGAEREREELRKQEEEAKN